MKNRNHFLDNLRTFLIFCVIVVHSGLVYEEVLVGSWITIDPEKSGGIGLVRLYLDAFIMYLWFFVAGYFIYYSRSTKTLLKFIETKFFRLVLPWLFGIVLLIPLYKYIFLYSRGLPQEEWYTYFHFYLRPGGNPYYFADNPVQNWLWFLPVLFLFQMIYLAIPKSFFTKISFKKAVLIMIAIGTVYGWIISLMGWTGWHHSFFLHFQRERIVTYFLVFLIGSFAYHQKVFDSIFNSKSLYIWMNVILTVFMAVFTVVALNLFFNMIDPNRSFYFINHTMDRLVYYLSQILTMISIGYLLLHTFQKYFNKTNKIWAGFARSSYHVYLIHVIIIGIIAMMIIPISISPWIKYAFLSLATFVVSNIISVLYQRFKGLLSSNRERDW